MFFYARETKSTGNHSRTAGVKARDDLETIFSEEGMTPIDIPSLVADRSSSGLLGKLLSHNRVYKVWRDSIANVNNGDILIIQFPVIEHTVGLATLLKEKKKKGIKLVLFIHDLELFRYTLRKDISLKRKLRLKIEELSILKMADIIVVHNEMMKKQLSAATGITETKMISIGIFDYLIDCASNDNGKIDQNKGVVISGNLDPQKAGYVYHLPENVDFNLYGVNYKTCTSDNIVYHGSFPSDEIVNKMEGSFGLVWDGDSTKSCEGAFGDYLRINNPHKTSLYLAAGLPVIIWREAALAGFINDNKLGILIDSLDEISDSMNSISESDYDVLLLNVQSFCKKLSKGHYTKNVITRIKELIF